MYLLFDIGGTKTRIALSRDKKEIRKDDVVIIPTNPSFKKAIDEIESVALSLSNKEKFSAVAGGIGGPIDKEKSKLVYSKKPTLMHWVNKNLAKAFREKFGCPIFLEDDAALAGLGEAVFGAAKKFEIVAYITVSTGVGGAKISDKQIDENAMGFEVGNQIIDPDLDFQKGQKGYHGRLEELIGGQYIQQYSGKRPQDISDAKFWDKKAYYLALGLNNTIVHWSPNVIVLGGPVMNHIPIQKVKSYLKKMIEVFPHLPKIKKGELGDLAGLYGALHYLNTPK